MKKLSEAHNPSVDDLIGLGGQSARKSYYPVLQRKVEELEAERNRYKWLFENALHGIFQARLTDGVILRANPTLVRLCGYSSARLEGVLSLADLLQHADEFDVIQQRLSEEGQLFLYQSRILSADNRVIDVSMNLLVRPDTDGDIIEAFVADVTAQRRMQARILQVNEELEQRVAARTAELLDLNDRLREEVAEREAAEVAMALAKDAAEAANHSKDKYLAAASHDLLQPMNAARLLVSALRERQLAETDQALVERVHIALSGAEHLLSDLLDISKLDQNAVQPHLQNFAVMQMLSNLEAEFQPLAEEAGLTFKVRAGNYFICSDLRLLSRIVRNLVANAIRYTERGTVMLALRPRRDHLRIEVWDTGPGIPADKQREIFKEFHQLEERDRGRGGVGLGLAIVERIARILDHPIDLVSYPGQGSRFAVTVPRAAAEDVVQRFEPAAGNTNALGGARVLVVDNEPDILVSMDALLDGWGCEVETATGLEDWLRQPEASNPPDLILADFHLDRGDTGVALVAELRQRYGKQIPAAMLTADRSDATRQLFREEGLSVLNKPIKPGKLRALMSHLLEAHDD